MAVPIPAGSKVLLLLAAGLFLCNLVPATDGKLVRRAPVAVAPRAAEFITTEMANAEENGAQRFLDDTGDRFIETLKNLSTYLPISVEYTILKTGDCDIIRHNRYFYERVPLIISAVMMVLGAIFCFLGYRLIKIVLFFIGFLIGFAITYFIIISVTYTRPEHWIPYVALASAGLVGILFGLLTICIYYIGIFLAGGSIGFLVTWFILSLINVGFFRDHIYVPVIIAVVMAVVVGVIALLLQKWFFMLGTAVLGGFLLIWGLDYYLELGSMIYYLFLFAENRSQIKPCWYSWVILPIFVILIIAGFLIQVFVTGRKYDHKKEMKGVCCGLCKRKKDVKAASDGKADYMKLKPVTDKEK